MRRLLLLLLCATAFAQVRYGDQVTTVSSLLTVTATGTGTGSVSSADGGIASCSSGGGTCTHTYTNGTLLTLTPTATGGSVFAWSSGTDGASSCAGVGACTFNITSTANVTAVFTGASSTAILASPVFSLDVNSSTQYPSTINHGQIRFWDTPNAQWSFIETANNVYSYGALDTILNNAAINQVHTAQFGLARTPNWASSNTNLTVTGAQTSGAFTASETVVQTGTGVSATFISATGTVLTISQYTSGTANASGTWVGQTSGAVFTPSATPAGCSYFTNGSTNPGQKSGQCAPPTDVNADGTGTDLIFRNWVGSISTHVNQAGYIAGTGGFAGTPHAHIAYYEVWNEPFATGKFWIGSYDQLIRFSYDAYCIIKGGAYIAKGSVTTGVFVAGENVTQAVTGSTATLVGAPVNGTAIDFTAAPTGSPDGTHIWTGGTSAATYTPQSAPAALTVPYTGETCATVRGTVTSAVLSGPTDTTAQMVMPSYQPSGASLMQCDLYCTPNVANQCGSPATSCTSGRGAALVTDRINFHAKPGQNLESSIPTQITGIQAVLATPELGKQLDDTEAGFSATGWSGAYLDPNMQAAYIARMYLYYLKSGVSNDVWYNWSPANTGLGSATANTAYTQVYNWLVGSTLGSVTLTSPQGSNCPVGVVCHTYTYTMTLANGVAAAMVWDTSQTCSGTPSICTTANQNVGSSPNYSSYLDLYGDPKISISNVTHLAPIGALPILVQVQ